MSRPRKEIPNPKKVNCGVLGAIHELIVCSDLLRKGYEVFRSVSQSCSCDLIGRKGNKLFRIEVTTATNRTFKDGVIKINYAKKQDAYKYDILALVIRDTKEIVYVPELSI